MKRAFTLVELLIVIIIIGILATMSIPQYQKMVNRAKWAECVGLAGAIKTAQSLYYAENGAYKENGILADLNTLDLPSSRKFNFSIKNAEHKIYGYSSTAGVPADNEATPPNNNFFIDLDDNSTGYNGDAPGSL